MCLIVLHWQPDAELSLQVWANRDEFRARPALPTEFWSETPQVLAGRDVLAGGTWMGVTRQGRFAAITNYRDPMQGSGQYSRGQLVADFLLGQQNGRRICPPCAIDGASLYWLFFADMRCPVALFCE